MPNNAAEATVIEAKFALLDSDDVPIESQLQAANFLLRQGYFDEVQPTLKRLCTHPATRPEARRLLAVCKQMHSWGIQGKLESYTGFDVVGFDRSVRGVAEVMLARRPGSTKCIVVFTGAAKQIWVSLHILHQIMPSDCHIIYLRDHSSSGYLTGLNVFGIGFGRMVDGLQGIFDSLGVKDVHVLGSSAGGFAALSFGLMIKAVSMLSFSPQTEVGETVRLFAEAALPQGDTPWGQPGSLPPFLDIVEHYKNTSYHPPLTLTFGGANVADAPAALRMAGLPGVILNEAFGYERHDILAWCFANGQIRELVKWMMEAKTE